MGDSMRILARAKVNLSLKILGRRPDGFHALRSVMVPLSLADRLTLTFGGRSGLRLSCPDAPALENLDNLALRAATAFAEAYRLPAAGLHIRLEKRIPVAAGLGGGSSDAAAVLRGLARRFGVALEELTSLAASLGSDVPFFLRQRPAILEGRGERVSAAPKLPPLYLLLVKPQFGISAADAYRAWSSGHSPALLAGDPGWRKRWAGQLSAPRVGQLLDNDLQAGCLALRPELGSLLERLRGLQADGVLLSGSGSTCFAAFANAARRDRAFRSFAAASGETLIRTRTGHDQRKKQFAGQRFK